MSSSSIKVDVAEMEGESSGMRAEVVVADSIGGSQ